MNICVTCPEGKPPKSPLQAAPPQSGYQSCPTRRYRPQDGAAQPPPWKRPPDLRSPPTALGVLGDGLHQIIRTEASVENALPEQLGQHKQIGPENQGSHKHRDLILKEGNISSLVPLNQHNYAEAFADSPPVSLYPSPRYCSLVTT